MKYFVKRTEKLLVLQETRYAKENFFTFKIEIMETNYFFEPLTEEVLHAIAEKQFPENSHCDKFSFVQDTERGLSFGSFSARLTGHHAKVAGTKLGNFYVIQAPGDFVHFLEIREREYFVFVVYVDQSVPCISLFEQMTGTIQAKHLLTSKTHKQVDHCNLIFLIPRKGNNRSSEVGVAIRKEKDASLYIEFKRDGRVLPALN